MENFKATKLIYLLAKRKIWGLIMNV